MQKIDTVRPVVHSSILSVDIGTLLMEVFLLVCVCITRLCLCGIYIKSSTHVLSPSCLTRFHHWLSQPEKNALDIAQRNKRTTIQCQRSMGPCLSGTSRERRTLRSVTIQTQSLMRCTIPWPCFFQVRKLDRGQNSVIPLEYSLQKTLTFSIAPWFQRKSVHRRKLVCSLEQLPSMILVNKRVVNLLPPSVGFRRIRRPASIQTCVCYHATAALMIVFKSIHHTAYQQCHDKCE